MDGTDHVGAQTRQNPTETLEVLVEVSGGVKHLTASG
jgi:hypothetical protein